MSRRALAASLAQVADADPISIGWANTDILRTCTSDIFPLETMAWDRKGLTMDDTTLEYCADRTPELWPNSLAPVKSVRLFRAWHRDWYDKVRNPKADSREHAWHHLRRFAVGNGAKFLLGTQISCNPDSDLADWYHVKDFAKLLGREHIMGLAVGNELDLLYTSIKDDKTVTEDCVDRLWGGEFWEAFVQRVEEFDSLGFGDIPVTSVFSAAALGGDPFQEEPKKALVKSFLEKATAKYGTRYAFTFNHYAYFDPSQKMDAGSISQCTKAVADSTCWHTRCWTPLSMMDARNKIERFTKSREYLYWVGETGWSSPQPKTLNTPMALCREWSSLDAFKRFYSGFLKWDLTIPGAMPPDHVFYFSIRTSLNYGKPEYFGLIDQCSNISCKIHSPGYTAPMPPAMKQEKVLHVWRKRGFEALGALVFLSLLGTWTYVTLVPEHWKHGPGARVLQDATAKESSSSGEDSSS